MTDLLEGAATAAMMTRMLADQGRFDATRPPCPSAWCDATCQDEGHFGDAVFHVSPEITTPTTSDRVNEPNGSVRVRAWRYDSLSDPTESGVELDLSAAKWLFPECANFTAAQARRLAAALIYAATLLEPTGGIR